ncbi:MAG: preprotein translocase subunit SecE [Patescibacteria group bacterium]
MFNLVEYFKASKAELKKVSWLSKDEVKDHTLVVIGISLGVAIFLGLIDLGFVQIFKIIAK